MCFMVKQTAKAKKMAEKYGASKEEIDAVIKDVSEKLNAFDHPQLTIISNDDSMQMRWGLIPNWVKDRESALEIQNKTLNCRAETAFEKPSFKDAIRHRRCVIPVDAFYEWQHQGKEKIPYIIKPSNREVLALAGIWEEWHSPVSDTPVKTFSILTCAANSTMAVIHNSKLRMPVILSEDHIEEWLSPLNENSIQELTVPCPDSWLLAEMIADEHGSSQECSMGI